MSITRTAEVSLKKEEEKPTENKAEKKEKVLILKLEEKPKPRVSWTEDTVDNEGMNKKKSNRKAITICSLLHIPSARLIELGYLYE